MLSNLVEMDENSVDKIKSKHLHPGWNYIIRSNSIQI